jgi:hypothetical protein
MFYVADPVSGEEPSGDSRQIPVGGRTNGLRMDERTVLTEAAGQSRTLLSLRAGLAGRGGDPTSGRERTALREAAPASGRLLKMKGGDSLDIYNRYREPRGSKAAIFGKIIAGVVLGLLALAGGVVLVGVIVFCAGGGLRTKSSGLWF